MPPIEKLLRLRLVRPVLGTEGVLLRRVAVLLHEQLGMRLLDRGHLGQRRLGQRLELLHVLRGLDLGGQRERHEDGAAVLGDRVRAVLRVERALDVADALEVAEAADHVLHGGGDLRRIGLDRALALDQDALADGVGEAGVVDDHRAALGVAVAGLQPARGSSDRRCRRSWWRARRRGSIRGWRSCGAWHSICLRVPRDCGVAFRESSFRGGWGAESGDVQEPPSSPADCHGGSLCQGVRPDACLLCAAGHPGVRPAP